MPQTSIWWDKLDLACFKLLNGSLEHNYFWQVFWSLANVKATDLFGAFFMVGFSLLWVFDGSKQESKVRLAQFFYILLWFEIGILVLKELIFPYLVQIDFLRSSPSLICSSPFMLSHVAPWLKIKDSSHWSFPGDHAFIVFEWAGFIMAFGGRKLGILAFISSLFFIMPRWIGGAHWISDSFAGSLPLALIFVAWARYTPIYTICIPYIESFSNLFFINRTKVVSNAAA